MSAATRIVRVAVPAPLRRCFDYLAPTGLALQPGMRLRVPFGRRHAVGVLIETDVHSDIARSRLKHVTQVLDAEPLLPAPLLALLHWAATYYHHPLGEVMHAALPVALRGGQAPAPAVQTVWAVTAAGAACATDTLARAPLRRRLLVALQHTPEGLDTARLRALAPGWSAAMQVLAAQGLVEPHRRTPAAAPVTPTPGIAPPTLNPDQADAAQRILAGLGGFHGFLLHGVTGSGKTEVYLRVIAAVLAQDQQALVLVPEIGLTPQLVARFQARFPVPIAVLHSGLTDPERLAAWLAARDGRASIVLGTRSAVFAPLARPGLIVIDEEHDASFKQQDGFRYHARDVAVKRARAENIPIVLGSATPALESLNNARAGRYQLLELQSRTGSAGMPTIHLLDLRRLPVADGLARPLVEAIAERLARGEQSLLFLNRRGFAPVLMCPACGWLAPCPRCDARLTLHRRSRRLLCHHCGAQAPVPQTCPACGAGDLLNVGHGTERIEHTLAQRFPRARLLRIDRDTTRRKGALEENLRRAESGEADILIGTQMLAKGHDFPNLTLVGILDADQGLYGVDFRAGERLFQLITQVAGRAGRAAKPGEVLIQTLHPDNPLFDGLIAHDYARFADYALAERRTASYPPFAHLALLRAESPHPRAALRFLAEAHARARTLLAQGESARAVQLMEPVPAPMERRAGRYRAQLLVQSAERGALHAFLAHWLAALETRPQARRARWSLDVDPVDMH